MGTWHQVTEFLAPLQSFWPAKMHYMTSVQSFFMGKEGKTSSLENLKVALTLLEIDLQIWRTREAEK